MSSDRSREAVAGKHRPDPDMGGPAALPELKSNVLVRYAVERAFMAVDAALRDVSPELLTAHGIPIRMISGFRNILAHAYDDLLDERVILTIRDDLPELDAALDTLQRSLGG